MNKVPSMMGTKDLSYLEDMFNWSMNANKISSNFLDMATDKDVLNITKEIAAMYKSHCKKFLKLIEGGKDE
jgi:hypothetical protein